MKFFILLALAAVALSSSTDKVKGGRRAAVFNLPANGKVRAEDVEQLLRLQNDYDDVDVEPVGGELRQAAGFDAQIAGVPSDTIKADSASGRMFLKKLLLFGSLFNGNSNTQPIIPIIITGTGTNTGTTTTTGTITGTGTITTSPQSRAGGIETDDYLIGEEDIIDESQKSNANRRQNMIKLKQGKANQQGLSFVVPPKYMRYLQNGNGQAVVVNPAIYNSGANKLRKVRLNNNGNVKRKRSRAPVVRRLIPSQ